LEDAVIDEIHMVYYKSVGRPFFSGLLGLEDFSKFFPRGTVVIFGFTHRKLRKEPFLLKFSKSSHVPPSDVHG